MSFLGKLFGKKEKESLDQGLEKTKQGFFERISKVLSFFKGFIFFSVFGFIILL